jgi:hypothetical protein
MNERLDGLLIEWLAYSTLPLLHYLTCYIYITRQKQQHTIAVICFSIDSSTCTGTYSILFHTPSLK